MKSGKKINKKEWIEETMCMVGIYIYEERIYEYVKKKIYDN